MKTGCAKSLLMIAGLGAVWYALFHLWFPPQEAIAGSLACGFGSLMIVGGIQSAFKALRAASGIGEDSFTSDMRPGAGAPEDGKLITVVGRIRATGPTLRAPFSQRACLLYQYEVSRSAAGSRGDNPKAFAGFALTPSVIDASNRSIKLLGFPELEGFDSETLEEAAAPRALDSFGQEVLVLAQSLQNARAYIAATSFEDMQGFAAVGKAWGAIKERIADDDGTVRKDWQMVDKSYDISESTLSEEIIVSGEQVCATGVYSAAKGGIVSDLSKGLNKLVKGDAQQSAALIRLGGLGQGIFSLVGGTVFGLVIIGAAMAILLDRTPQPGTGQLLALVHSVHPEAPITRQSLAATDAEVVLCKRWLASVQNEDRNDLHDLSATDTRTNLAEVQFDEWKAARPAKASLVQGTSIGDHAVVVMRGTRPDGTSVDGTFKLERDRDGWRVRDERWEPAIR
ncbi:MAG: hypothetical protein ABIP63_03395 [Thermoanaerobaculia bacterium]